MCGQNSQTLNSKIQHW